MNCVGVRELFGSWSEVAVVVVGVVVFLEYVVGKFGVIMLVKLGCSVVEVLVRLGRGFVGGIGFGDCLHGIFVGFVGGICFGNSFHGIVMVRLKEDRKSVSECIVGSHGSGNDWLEL